MNESPAPRRPQSKLMTKGKFVTLLCALLVGVSFNIVREYRAKSTVSAATIGASIVAFLIGLIILVVISRYANKPEQ